MINETDKKLPRLIPEMTAEKRAEFEEVEALGRKKVATPDFLENPELNRQMIEDTELRENLSILYNNVDPQNNLPTIRQRVAEILVKRGEFLRAAMYADGPYRDSAFSYRQAEILDAGVMCEHYKGHFVEKGKKIEDWYIERDNVPSKKYGKPVPILRCNVCGFRNMRPLADGEAERFRHPEPQ
jgi:hypothetical protein